jgi:peptide/nickel transport system permease protein
MAREPMVWWTLLAAFGLMFTLVLSANLFADAVQHAFDPRMQTLSEKTSILRRSIHRKNPISPATATPSSKKIKQTPPA